MHDDRSLLSRSGRAFRAGSAWALSLGLLLTTACQPYPSEDYPFTTTDVSSDFGEMILDPYLRITYVITVVFVAVFALLFYTLWRFRDDGSEGNPEQIHGNLVMEIGWTLLPVLLVLIMIVPTIRTIFTLADAAEEGALEIRVIGKRWWWEFQYPKEGIVTANELHVPVGRPLSFLLESDSVIHSFWTPRLGGKRDAVPGRVNRIWMTIKDVPEPGKPLMYRGECAEYCGESHALMRYDVFAYTEEDYEGWLTKMKAPPAIDPAIKVPGEAAFTAGGCVGCHAITGNETAMGRKGPDLTGFGSRRMLAAGTRENTAENLAQWLHDPNSVKPGTGGVPGGAPGRFDGMNIPTDLTDEQVDALVAYLQALK